MNTNKLIKFFTISILFIFLFLGNLGGCSNSSNMTEPEPTPASTPEPTPASTPEPTPIPTPEPTPVPTPEPTRIPAPIVIPPSSVPSQESAATAIAITCASLIAEASTDDPGGQLLASYKAAVDQITALKLPAGPSDIPAATAIIKSAVIERASRGDAELLERAEELADICEIDIDAL